MSGAATDSVDPIPVAVLGAGYWGSLHARKYREMPGARLVAVVDPDLDRARAAAGDSGAVVVPDHRSLPAEVRAASVAAPTPRHHELALELLDRGVDLLVEKPMTVTLDEADALVVAARERGRVLQVGHLERFNPAVVALGDRVQRPLFVECERLGPFPERSADVDVVLDVMIHDLDLVLHWVRRPVTMVHALGVAVITDRTDIANVRLEFEGGCVANVSASRVSLERSRKVRVFQPSGYLSIDLAARQVAAVRRDGDGIAPDAVVVPEGDALADELSSFVASVRDRTPPRVTGEEGRDALALARRILDEMEAHQARVDDLPELVAGERA